MDEQQAPPNHHANYPGFAGVAGLIAALSMAFGRKGDARLAVRLSGMGSGDMVVDIGCGPGVAVRYAARWVRRSPESIQRPSCFGSRDS